MKMWNALALTVFAVALCCACVGCVGEVSTTPCTELFASMVCCETVPFDVATNQPMNCLENNTYTQRCFALAGVECDGVVHEAIHDASAAPDNNTVECNGVLYHPNSTIFTKTNKCYYVDKENKKRFGTTLALSVFFGALGFDRFYLGYPAIGLAKLCTLGFFFIGQLVDIVLIALQVVGPADGTAYFMEPHEPRVVRRMADAATWYPPEE
eukprot:m.26314 g.26314  ORF g.26314 m.26314 type:complete len:211 (-) comp8811_c0_seq2:267-899(-)